MDEALKKDPNYCYTWLAIVGLLDKSKNDEDIKKSEYENISKIFTSPYMKALFNYILYKEDSVQAILVIILFLLDKKKKNNYFFNFKNDGSLLFQDRIALSVHFLFQKENELKNYFNKMIEDCTKTGNLQGVLLTGLSKTSIKLFQVYIDKTSDLQSIALIIMHSTFQEVLEDNQVKSWIDR